MTKKLVVLGAGVAVLLPIITHINNVQWANSPLLPSIFPIFGLLAFTLLWLHAISGSFEEWLRENFNFDAFVSYTATIILVSMLAPVTLLLILLKFNIPMILSGGLR